MRNRTAARLLILVGALFGSASFAQGSAPPASANPSVTALVQGVNEETHRRDLQVRTLNVTVRVRGSVAETEMEMRIAAPPGEDRLEGRIHVELPAGSVVTGYALDVNGAMLDGVLVDTPKARAAYEQQVRQRVDPGVAEVDQAGGFNTRVFPVDSKAGRGLRLRFVTAIGTGYRLPLRTLDPAADWRITVTGVGSNAVLLGSSRPVSREGSLQFNGKGAVADTLVLADRNNSDAIASRHPAGETYWQLSGDVPRAMPHLGGAMRIYWDRSRSRRDADHTAELKRVREAIDAFRPRRIEWVDFSSSEGAVAILDAFDAVEKNVAGLRYEGATSFPALATGGDSGICLLVSDGRSTLDQGPPVPPKCRVFAIAIGPSADRARLGWLASSTGGQLIDGESKVDWQRPVVEAVEDAAGRRLEFLTLPSSPAKWHLIVRAPNTGPARVRIGGADEIRVASAPVMFAGEGALLAAARLSSIEATTDRAAFVAESRRYSISNPSLSFLVLETAEDYVRADVEPPASFSRKDEWAELRKDADEDGAKRKEERFDSLLKDWQEQVAWWEKKFDLAARPQPVEQRKAMTPPVTAVPAPEMNAPVSSPPAPAPPPPPPPRAAERDSEGDSDQPGGIVVTGSRMVAPDVAISVAAWRPERDYLKAFDANPGDFGQLYAEWERKAGDVPAFYLDVADWMSRHGREKDAADILMSALDLPTADAVTIGMVATRLERYGLLDKAVRLRERFVQLDPERPQPKRLLALALAKRAERGGANAKADLGRSIALLLDIALSPVDDRWAGIDLISLTEANAILARLQRIGGTASIDARLVKNLDSDVRVVIDWSNDASDIDLWVDEPNGERAIYNHPRTLIGGHLSNDMTSGYGPEEYFLRKAARGRYTVRANVYAQDQLDPNGASRVTARLIKDWGRPTEREESIDVDLSRGQAGELRIGTLRVGQ